MKRDQAERIEIMFFPIDDFSPLVEGIRQRLDNRTRPLPADLKEAADTPPF